MVSRNREEIFVERSGVSQETSARGNPLSSMVTEEQLENNISHIMCRSKFLSDRQITIHPGFLLQIQEKDNGLVLNNFLRKMSKWKSLTCKISVIDQNQHYSIFSYKYYKNTENNKVLVYLSKLTDFSRQHLMSAGLGSFNLKLE